MSRLGALTRGQRLILILLSIGLVGVLAALVILATQAGHFTLMPVATVAQPTLPSLPSPLQPPSPSPTLPATPSPTPETAGELAVARRAEAVREASARLRELPFRQRVPLTFLSQEAMAEDLADWLAAQALWQEAWQFYVVLGLLPPQEKAEVSVLGERAARWIVAFYRPGEGQLYLRRFQGPPGEEKEALVAHAYTHALQDQHFDLAAYLAEADSADAARARLALPEGEATWVMARYLNAQAGLTFTERVVDELIGPLVAGENPAFSGQEAQALAPILRFPYANGARFVARLLEEGWWPALNDAYRRPPRSTEEVLHPEKYLAGDDPPRSVSLPDLQPVLGEGWALVEQDVMGELVLRTVLTHTLQDGAWAERAAAGWGGDRYQLWRDEDGNLLLLARTLWDSEADAAEFAEAYEAVIALRLSGAFRVVPIGAPPQGQWWRREGLTAFLDRQGEVVTFAWGRDTPAMVRLLAALFLEDRRP